MEAIFYGAAGSLAGREVSVANDFAFLGHKGRVNSEVGGDVSGKVDISLGDKPQGICVVVGGIKNIIRNPNVRI